MLVIFDCDGVLVDSESLDCEVLEEAFAQEGLVISRHEIDVKFRGKSVPDCIRLAQTLLAGAPEWKGKSTAQQEVDIQTFWRKKQLQCIQVYTERLQAIPGVEEVIRLLKDRNIPVCVASNGKHEKMAVTLVKAGLKDLFGTNIFSFEEVKQGKPAPDLFLYAASKMGVSPAETYVVEDSLSGVTAALAAGMKPFAYCPPQADGAENYLLPEIKKKNVVWFSDMKELPQLLLGSNLS